MAEVRNFIVEGRKPNRGEISGEAATDSAAESFNPSCRFPKGSVSAMQGNRHNVFPVGWGAAEAGQLNTRNSTSY
jgi:hypothetical protein